LSVTGEVQAVENINQFLPIDFRQQPVIEETNKGLAGLRLCISEIKFFSPANIRRPFKDIKMSVALSEQAHLKQRNREFV